MRYQPRPWMSHSNVLKDEKSNTITVYADIFIYGTKASETLAANISKDVRDAWNRPQAKVAIKGKFYRVHFSVRGYYVSNLQPWIHNNTDYKRVFVRIEEKTDHPKNADYMDVQGGNSGYFKYGNVAGVHSTTEAHEMGHRWGLWPGTADSHPLGAAKGQPGIMYPRGTWSDPAYQYDSQAKPGAKGGTLDPEKRKVTTADILMLGLQQLSYDPTGRACLGKLTNKIKLMVP